MKQNKEGKLALWLSVLQGMEYSGKDTKGSETESRAQKMILGYLET